MLLVATAHRKTCVGGTPPNVGDDDAVPTGEVFTIDNLVVYLKIPKSTVYKLAQEGKIPGQKIGRHWRFHKDTIDEWLSQGQEQQP